MTNEELQKEMIAAMKAKDKVRLSIIRQVKAEVKNIEVNERRDVTEEDVNSMIKRLIKQTSETLEMSIKAGTDQERTDNLTEQVKILEGLLPAQVSGEELEALIEQVIAELGATSKKQMSESLSWMQTGDTLALSGELDQDVLLPLWEMREEAVKGITCIDLSRVSRVDTGGLALLLHLIDLAKKQGNNVTLQGVNDKVYTLAKLYNLPADVLPR